MQHLPAPPVTFAAPQLDLMQESSLPGSYFVKHNLTLNMRVGQQFWVLIFSQICLTKRRGNAFITGVFIAMLNSRWLVRLKGVNFHLESGVNFEAHCEPNTVAY